VHLIERGLVGVEVAEGELVMGMLMGLDGVVPLSEFEILGWVFLLGLFVLVVWQIARHFLIFFLFKSFEGAR
jgi:hydrogenase/urease accessory protein HupE